MTLYDFVGLLRRQWLLVVAGCVLGLLIAISAIWALTPSYSTTTRLYVASVGSTPDGRLENAEYARTRVASYADLVDSPVVLDVVQEKLGLSDADGRLVDDVSASNPLDTLIIDVTVSDPDPRRAYDVATEIGGVFDSVVGELETSADSAGSPVLIRVVRPAALPTEPDFPSMRLFTAAGLIVGLIVGLTAARLRDSWRRLSTESSGLRTAIAHRDDEEPATVRASSNGALREDARR